jgi:hypothetical protein
MARVRREGLKHFGVERKYTPSSFRVAVMSAASQLAFRAVVLCAVASCAACNSNELTRSRAARVLEQSAPFSKPIAIEVLPWEAHKAGLLDGVRSSPHSFFADKEVLTELGKQFLREEKSERGLGLMTWTGPSFVLKDPRQRKLVEITGITDAGVGPSTKLVQFLWTYADLPEWVTPRDKPFEGEVVLQLFDDGWRIADAAALEEKVRRPMGVDGVKLPRG